MFTTTTTVRVRYAETDKMSVVYHGNYALYFEIGRTEAIRQLGYSYKDLETSGILMPVVELHTKFLRPAFYDDVLTIKTILPQLPTNHLIAFRSEIYNQAGKLLTTGEVVLCFIKADTRQKTNMPDDWLEKLAGYYQ